MKILSIETSCDETALSIVETSGHSSDPVFTVLADVTLTQTIHSKWGGVVPNLAKREHAKNLVPLLEKVLTDANIIRNESQQIDDGLIHSVEELLVREADMSKKFLSFAKKIKIPEIDLIAVTYGPGLEPALWVGINFAKALSKIWNVPIVPVDHMKGHIFSVLINEKGTQVSIKNIKFPAVSLLISGGHTELVFMKDLLSYEVIGKTRDDAVGEAFDKVARILGLPYPGGPEISKLAGNADTSSNEFLFTPPMLNSGDYDFSFSGLKTQVLYVAKEIGELSSEQKENMAYAFESAVTESLLSKTKKAVHEYNAKTVIIGGGVSANTRIREDFSKEFSSSDDISLLLPEKKLSTDNALMIAIAGYFAHQSEGAVSPKEIIANGNLSLS